MQPPKQSIKISNVMENIQLRRADYLVYIQPNKTLFDLARAQQKTSNVMELNRYEYIKSGTSNPGRNNFFATEVSTVTVKLTKSKCHDQMTKMKWRDVIVYTMCIIKNCRHQRYTEMLDDAVHCHWTYLALMLMLM